MKNLNIVEVLLKRLNTEQLRSKPEKRWFSYQLTNRWWVESIEA